VSKDGRILKDFYITTAPGYQKTPQVAHGNGWKGLVVYSGFAGPPYNSMRIWATLLGNSAPSVFSLLSPMNGDTVSTLRPSFSWSRAVDPDGDPVSYTLYLSVDSTYTRADSVAMLSDTSYTLEKDLVNGRRYYWKVKAVDSQGDWVVSRERDWWFVVDTSFVGVEEETGFRVQFKRVWPNPSRGEVEIRYSVGGMKREGKVSAAVFSNNGSAGASPSRVSLKIYNVAGQLVRVKTLVNEPENPGANKAIWDGKDSSGREVSSGVYILRLETNEKSLTKKAIVLR